MDWLSFNWFIYCLPIWIIYIGYRIVKLTSKVNSSNIQILNLETNLDHVRDRYIQFKNNYYEEQNNNYEEHLKELEYRQKYQQQFEKLCNNILECKNKLEYRLRVLEYGYTEVIKKLEQNIAKDLDEAYEKLLNKIDSEDADRSLALARRNIRNGRNKPNA